MLLPETVCFPQSGSSNPQVFLSGGGSNLSNRPSRRSQPPHLVAGASRGGVFFKLGQQLRGHGAHLVLPQLAVLAGRGSAAAGQLTRRERAGERESATLVCNTELCRSGTNLREVVVSFSMSLVNRIFFRFSIVLLQQAQILTGRKKKTPEMKRLWFHQGFTCGILFLGCGLAGLDGAEHPSTCESDCLEPEIKTIV